MAMTPVSVGYVNRLKFLPFYFDAKRYGPPNLYRHLWRISMGSEWPKGYEQEDEESNV